MKSRPFACESARRRTIHSGGLELHALEWGVSGRPALCFLHGGSAHAHWFDEVVLPFIDRFHVISLDQRGHGRSDWPRPPAYGTEDFASDLRAVMGLFGWERMVLVGHSMGGHNAMAFAAWHPQCVEALVVVDSRPAIPGERLDRLRARGRRVLRRYPTATMAEGSFHLLPRETMARPAVLAHLAREGLVQRDGAWVYRFDPACNSSRDPVDAWPLLERIAAPTLLIRGGRSPILPPEMAERMLRAIPGASLVEVAEAYHHLMLDAPVAFVAALGSFLNDRRRS